jgi:ABC-type antimicrobial peptide transport system permease subunit
MFVGFAITALLMAAAGLYATMAYNVSQRRQEIGIRMALGARGREVQAMVLGQGARLTLVSLGLGLLGRLGFGRAMESLLFGVTATDPLTYDVVIALLGLVALLASYLPALKATRVDPIRTLRAE